MNKRILTRIERRRLKYIDIFKKQLETRKFLSPEEAIVITEGVSGLYSEEIKAIVNTLSDKNITSMVEIGRCLGGSIYRYLCCFPIKKFLSIDIQEYLTDQPLRDFMNHHNIQNEILVADSSKYIPEDFIWDFVFIDGDHSGPGVRADINVWKDRCKYIGFHDYADRHRNKHRRYYSEVVDEVKKASIENGWIQVGTRGKSEIIFKTKRA